VRPPTINSSVAALRFFFTVTLSRAEMARHLTFVREPRKIPHRETDGMVVPGA
jgi:integrase/recombinase XerD